jgi:hypothetical protein
LNDRLPATLEASSLLRRAEAEGGFGTVLKRGDADRGALLLVILSRGVYVTCLERTLNASGTYEWQRSGPADSESSGDLAGFLDQRTRFDADLWLIELDIVAAERFIAETTAVG